MRHALLFALTFACSAPPVDLAPDASIADAMPDSGNVPRWFQVAPDERQENRWEAYFTPAAIVDDFTICHLAEEAALSLSFRENGVLILIAVAPPGEPCISERSGAGFDIVLHPGITYTLVAYSLERPHLRFDISTGEIRILRHEQDIQRMRRP